MTEKCSVTGCEGKVSARGWCGSHYGVWRRSGSPIGRKYKRSRDLICEALESCTDDCVIWDGAKIPSGYGHCRFRGKTIGAHRAVLISATGIDPNNKDAAHTCHNKSCVNPRHLRWLSHSENMLESSWKWTSSNVADA